MFFSSKVAVIIFWLFNISSKCEGQATTIESFDSTAEIESEQSTIDENVMDPKISEVPLEDYISKPENLGISWQAALVGVAVFIVPWTLFFTAIFERVRTNTKIDYEQNKVTSSGKSKKFEKLDKSEKNEKLEKSVKPEKSETSKTSKTSEKIERSDENNIMDASNNDTTPDLKEENSPSATEDDEINAAPLHLHAMRIPDARLRGTQRSLSFNSRNSSRSSSRSRSRSTSPSTGRSKSKVSSIGQELSERLSNSSSSSTIADGEMSSSAVDILTDRKCFEDIEPNSHDSHNSFNNSLPSVNERMSEDKLDDSHAFSDVAVNGSMKKDRKILPPVNERISNEKLDDSDAFKQVTIPERRASLGKSNSVNNIAGDSDISCNNSILETFEEEEEEEEELEEEGTDDNIKKDEDEELKKQKLSHDVLFELLGTVSTPKEKRELNIIRERSRRLSFSD